MFSEPLIEFENTKDGNKTFKINNTYYHSKYSPLREAERFIETHLPTFNPTIFFIIEPGFDYLSKILRSKYPESKIIKIQIINNLNDINYHWDKIIDFNSSLESIFKYEFSEEMFLNSQLLIWPPALSNFKEETMQIVNSYKNSFEYHKTILTTREYFEKKWLINSLNNFIYSKNILKINKKINKPVLITASGPSLNNIISNIKNIRGNIFLLALSSSLKALLENDIIPDLVLSTDGGYWAGQHLKSLFKYNIPIAITSEAFLQKKILTKNNILLLNYSDDIISEYIDKNINCPAQRCGTVSGTALFLAQNLTDKEIYFSGLDLNCCKGYQHIQPNELEIINNIYDNRIKTKSLRLLRSELNSNSLEIYCNWFKELKNIKKIYRIIDKPKNNLEQITDISSDNFIKNIKISKSESNIFVDLTNDCKIDFESFLKDLKFNTKLSKRLFPADYISLKKCLNEDEKNCIINRLDDKLLKVKNQIQRLLND